VKVHKPLAKKVTKQDYRPKTTIDGVKIVDLKRHLDDQGEFAELGRLQAGILESLSGFEVRQVNHSLLQPGAVKAWHLHENQDDVWFVPPDERLLVGLLDVRDGSKTVGATQRLILGDGNARLLFIPRGVAHGAANVSPRPARILYFVNRTFDAKNPDELRLPTDAAGAEFWTMSKG
jgi:dTDP-4-dehydrorhamnose 3,5-epimerase